jgi:siroheme synthase (precorrin-2 oxidase/ferrochelatase)
VRVADVYMTVRPLRFVVRLAAPRGIRARIRYVADESKWLKRLAREIRTSMRSTGEEERDVSFTIPALVGYWGRLLVSVNTPRTRRRLSKSELETRQSLIPRFQEAISSLLPRNRREIEEQLQTRRAAEEIWMRDRLGLPQRHAAG